MRANRSERGSALMLVTIIVLILVGISAAYMSISSWNQKRAFTDESGLMALYISESAAAQYINDLNAVAGAVPAPVTTTQHMAGGTFIIPEEDITFLKDGVTVFRRDQLFFTPTQIGDPNYSKFQIQGTYNGVTRRLDIVLSRNGGGAFWNVTSSWGMMNVPPDMCWVVVTGAGTAPGSAFRSLMYWAAADSVM